MARRHERQHCSAPIAPHLPADRNDTCADAVRVPRDGGDAGPAPPRADAGPRADVRDRATARAVDGGRLRRDGDHRRAALLCHPGADVPEHLLPDQGRRPRAGGAQRLRLSLDDRSPHRRVGSRSGSAAGGEASGRQVARALGDHRLCRPDDRLQLVRLRQAAAAADRQCPRRLRREDRADVAAAVLSMGRSDDGRRDDPRLVVGVCRDRVVPSARRSR